MSPAQKRELLGLALFGFAIFLGLSLIPVGAPRGENGGLFPAGNLMGTAGVVVAGWSRGLLGIGLPLVPLLAAVAGARCYLAIDKSTALRWGGFFAGMLVLLPTAVASLAGSGSRLMAGWQRPGGLLGQVVAQPLLELLGWFGAFLLLLFLATGLCVVAFGWNPLRMVWRGGVWSAQNMARIAGRSLRSRQPVSAPAGVGGEAATDPAADQREPEPAGRDVGDAEGFGGDHLPVSGPAEGGKNADPGRPGAELESGDLQPPLSLLKPAQAQGGAFSERELDRLGEVLLQTLRTFRVEGRIDGRTTGPVVTQYEVVPAPGIKVNRIAALDSDLALALKAPSIRIVAPIPGKGAVGVEVPNPEAEVVALRGILESAEYRRHGGQLPLALGKGLTGRPYVADLGRMPHLLIAGATGSGKSVCINTIITSLVFRHSPRSLKLLLLDPKMVELSMYADLPHLRHPVVTNPADAATLLKWTVMEMERRYELLSENGARSLQEFNRRVEDGQQLRNVEPDGPEDDPDRWVYKGGSLPIIVVVVDELADLIMSLQAEIERPLAQLAQKARAIGIHLIVATQRPSVNVITGLIKANFPSRIAFRVSSKVDSRTILDQNGADALLGNGDMLFLPPGHSDPVRIQGAFISTEESERMMAWYRSHWEDRAAYEEDDTDILQYVRQREADEAAEDSVDEALEDRDPLFRQAAEICIQSQQGSTSLLQRRLRIGYGRAARIIDQLHHAGVLGQPDGSRPREVLMGLDGLESVIGKD